MTTSGTHHQPIAEIDREVLEKAIKDTKSDLAQVTNRLTEAGIEVEGIAVSGRDSETGEPFHIIAGKTTDGKEIDMEKMAALMAISLLAYFLSENQLVTIQTTLGLMSSHAKTNSIH